MQVKVKGGEAVIRPIAGTRRRGKTEEEDQVLEKDLRNDPKEKAEHLMLVDLARNDLGRICEPGTVRVSTFMEVERYSHVMHRSLRCMVLLLLLDTASVFGLPSRRHVSGGPRFEQSKQTIG
jgi:isochorismate synthase EntC